MKSFLVSTGVLLLALGSLWTPPAVADPLEAGVAVVDITPTKPYRMCGYFHERLSTGTHDPLLAKAVVMRQGDRQAALVFCDLAGLSHELSIRARSLAEQKTGIPASNILLAATHTHTGPLYMGTMRKHLHDTAVAATGRDAAEELDYPAMLVQRLVDVIADAQAVVAPVRIGVGVGRETRLSFNRRFHMKNSDVVVFNPGKLNPNILREAGPIDPDVGVLLFSRANDAAPLAALTVFALHLDTVGGTEFSGDYPYYLEESLREDLGGKFVSMFGNGPCGDINHVDVTNRDPQRGNEEARRIGRGLAETVKSTLGELDPIQRPSLDVRTEVIDVPLQQYSAQELAAAVAALPNITSSGVPFLERVRIYKLADLQSRDGRTLPMVVQVFRLSPEVAIVALPGEVFVDLGLAIKQASPFSTTMIIELAHDAPGYLPTRKAFAEGSYETVNSRIAPGGGEILVETAVRLLNDMK